MAINSDRASTDVNNPNYVSPYTQANANAIAQGAAAGVQNANQAANDKLKALLQGKQTAANQAAAEAASKHNLGRSVKVDDVSFGVDPNADNQKKLMQTTSNEAMKLNNIYGKHASDLENAASQVESGLTGLNEGTPQGDKTAVAALTRLADGKGQRMTQAQLTSMTPDSAQGSVEKMMNYWQGAAETGLAPAQRAALGNLLQSHSKRLQSEFADTQNEFKEQAPFLAPTLAQTGQLNNYLNTFGQKGQQIFNRINDLSNQQPNNAQPALAANKSQGAVPQSVGLLGGLKNFLFGTHQTQPQGAMAQPQTQDQSAPGTFDPDAFLGGK